MGKGGVMHYECDYREKVAMEMAEIMAGMENEDKHEKTPEETALNKEEFRRILEISQLEESQYKLIPSKERFKAIHSGYCVFEEVARIQGGKVVLDISDDGMRATLQYTGKEMFQTGAPDDKMSSMFCYLLSYFPNLWIKAEGEEFTVTINAELYKKIKVKNLSRRIDKKRTELQSWTRSNRSIKE